MQCIFAGRRSSQNRSVRRAAVFPRCSVCKTEFGASNSLFQKPYPSFQALVPFSGIPQTTIFYKPAFSVIALAHDIPAPLFHLMSPRSALSRACPRTSRSRVTPAPSLAHKPPFFALPATPPFDMLFSVKPICHPRHDGYRPLNRQAAKKHTEVASSTSRRIIPMKRANVLPQLHMLFNLAWPPSPKHLPCFLRHLTHKR